MKNKILLVSLIILQIVSLLIFIYYIAGTYIPYFINTFINKSSPNKFTAYFIELEPSINKSILIKKILPKNDFADIIKDSFIEGVIISKTAPAVNEDINNCFIFDKNNYKEGINILTNINKNLENDMWFKLISFLLFILLIFIQISIVERFFSTYIKIKEKKPFFTLFYHFNFSIFTICLLIINEKIFQMFNSIVVSKDLCSANLDSISICLSEIGRNEKANFFSQS